MKKKILSFITILTLIIMLICLTGCANNDTNENTLTNESVETEQSENEQEEIKQNEEENTEGNTFQVGNYTLKYGRYSDGNVMVVNIKEDGTLYLNAVEQEYTIEGDSIKLKNLDLKVTSNEGFDHVVDGKVLTSYTYSELN